MSGARAAEPAPPLVTPWLTPAEIARMSRRCNDTVWDALRVGALHGHRRHPRGRWRVHADAVSAWIEADDPDVAAIASARACPCGKVRVLRPA